LKISRESFIKSLKKRAIARASCGVCRNLLKIVTALESDEGLVLEILHIYAKQNWFGKNIKIKRLNNSKWSCWKFLYVENLQRRWLELKSTMPGVRHLRPEHVRLWNKPTLYWCPLARITSAGREGLASGWITGGLRNKQQGGWNYVMETYTEDGWG